ncbi:MAG: hypothetical protein M3P93_08390 [Actinomycetota bacterium]|nr:hypothetical protein [Actinomycetota bacterium]
MPSLATWHDDWDAFDYRARASSALPVTLTAGPGCAAGTVVTVAAGPGQCRLEATQAGDDRFLPASPVVRAVDVTVADGTPAPLDRVFEARTPQAVLFAPPEDVLVTTRSRVLSATGYLGPARHLERRSRRPVHRRRARRGRAARRRRVHRHRVGRRGRHVPGGVHHPQFRRPQGTPSRRPDGARCRAGAARRVRRHRRGRRAGDAVHALD